jgi:hypothetical protein
LSFETKWHHLKDFMREGKGKLKKKKKNKAFFFFFFFFFFSINKFE